MRTILTTVGTSLLTNRDEGVPVQRPWVGWRVGQPLPEFDIMLAYLDKADMRVACAETNTLQALPLYEEDSLVFLHSDTPEGEHCARVLKEHFSQRAYPCELLKISGLGYHEATFTERGLKGFLDQTFRAIERVGPDRVVLCATGGFKAEIAFANLVGILMQIPVYYIHERFRELVELPRVPIEWDLSLVEQHLDFFEWIDTEPRPSAEAESWLRARPSLRTLTSESADGCTYLSPVGDLLYRAYRERRAAAPRAVWPPSSDLQPKEKIRLSGGAHHRPDGWEEFVRRLSDIDCIQCIRYDGKGPHEAPQTQIYRREPQSGKFGVVYKRGDRCLPLLVETTAVGEAQLEPVLDYLQRRIRKW